MSIENHFTKSHCSLLSKWTSAQEVTIIRFIYESYATGRYSDQDTADYINRQGYRNRARSRFSKDNLTEILTNVCYVGKVSYTAAKGTP